VEVSYEFGEIRQKVVTLGSQEANQDRATVAYSQALGAGLTGQVSATHCLNEDLIGGDNTYFSLGLSYDFGNGLSAKLTYSPDDSLFGGEFVENSLSLGVKYSF
jgi:predicted porin